MIIEIRHYYWHEVLNECLDFVYRHRIGFADFEMSVSVIEIRDQEFPEFRRIAKGGIVFRIANDDECYLLFRGNLNICACYNI